MSIKQRTAARSGFTLVEILTVLSIIALLAAILFPVLRSARLRASNVGCTAQLRQVGLALTQYVQDYDGLYPARSRDFFDGHCFAGDWGLPPEEVQEMPLLSTTLAPYVGNSETFRDPFTRGFEDDDNGNFCSATDEEMAAEPFTFVQRSELSIPAPVAFESLARPAEVDVLHTFGPWRDDSDLAHRWMLTLFADGHVKGMNRSAMVEISQTPLAFD